MSGKNLRTVQAGQRTNAEGKQVSNKVLLAMPDTEATLVTTVGVVRLVVPVVAKVNVNATFAFVAVALAFAPVTGSC